MKYIIQEITGKEGMQDFLDLPYKIYKDDPNWVAPVKSEIERVLDTRKNPYFKNVTLRKFVCYDGIDAIARVVVVINTKHWARYNRKSAFFGFFESYKNEEAVNEFFKYIGGYCRSQGAEYMEGPFNPNHYSELGILTNDSITQPAFFETYNPDYYPSLLQYSGFLPIITLHTRVNRATDTFVKQHYEVGKPKKRIGSFTARRFNLLRMKSELEKIREVFNDAFDENWHFLPISAEEYIFSAKYLFFITFPNLVIIVENGNEPVGVLQCVLNINPVLKPYKGKIGTLDYLTLLRKRNKIREIIIYAIGIKKTYRNSPVFKLMSGFMFQIVQKFPVVFTTWMTEDNIPAIKASEVLGLEPYKQFQIYEMKL